MSVITKHQTIKDDEKIRHAPTIYWGGLKQILQKEEMIWRELQGRWYIVHHSGWSFLAAFTTSFLKYCVQPYFAGEAQPLQYQHIPTMTTSTIFSRYTLVPLPASGVCFVSILLLWMEFRQSIFKLFNSTQFTQIQNKCWCWKQHILNIGLHEQEYFFETFYFLSIPGDISTSKAHIPWNWQLDGSLRNLSTHLTVWGHVVFAQHLSLWLSMEEQWPSGCDLNGDRHLVLWHAMQLKTVFQWC